MNSIHSIEEKRRVLQATLDTKKSQAERNKLGQFATPQFLSKEIMEYTQTLFSSEKQIRFLEPAFGTGSFYTSFLSTFPTTRIEYASAFELDPDYANAARELWEGLPLELTIGDFTKIEPPSSEESKFNLVVSNPPYVRHHHLDKEEKIRLKGLVERVLGRPVSGLSGLYCYFLLLAHRWLRQQGLSCWLIPSEFMDVNYGKAIKQYLINNVKLLKVHRFDPQEQQFDDALVSSVILWFKNESAEPNHTVEFSFGGSLLFPQKSRSFAVEELSPDAKWTSLLQAHSVSKVKDEGIKLSELFEIKRGIVTGANGFFIMTKEQIEEQELSMDFFFPIFPSPRYLDENEVVGDSNGFPLLEKQLFVFSSSLSKKQIQTKYPSVWKFLQAGEEKGIHKGYICSHRSPWYCQEQRVAAPLLCTYMGRVSAKSERPFRFIFNRSKAIAPNVYLMMYPKPELQGKAELSPKLLESIWILLNKIPIESLIGEGRVYGGGLHKLEPKELANASIRGLAELLPDGMVQKPSQLSLF